MEEPQEIPIKIKNPKMQKRTPAQIKSFEKARLRRKELLEKKREDEKLLYYQKLKEREAVSEPVKEAPQIPEQPPSPPKIVKKVILKAPRSKPIKKTPEPLTASESDYYSESESDSSAEYVVTRKPRSRKQLTKPLIKPLSTPTIKPIVKNDNNLVIKFY